MLEHTVLTNIRLRSKFINFKKIVSHSGAGGVNWPATGSNTLSKNSGESD